MDRCKILRFYFSNIWFFQKQTRSVIINQRKLVDISVFDWYYIHYKHVMIIKIYVVETISYLEVPVSDFRL